MRTLPETMIRVLNPWLDPATPTSSKPVPLSEVGVRDAPRADPLGFSSSMGLALPECALAHSERYAGELGKRHKKLTEWAAQLLLLVRRWYPEREIVAVADGTYYSSLKLLDRCRRF